MPTSFPPLACSVRGCGAALTRDGARWACPAGHSFDIARSGYLSLLQPQDRRSLDAGDARETVDARRALLDAGFGAALREALVELVGELGCASGGTALDLGCGDGHFLAAVCERCRLRGIGIDLSPHAVERCARRHGSLVWIAANADRRLPLLDGSVDLALSIDGRRPRDELARVLAPGGALVVAVPAGDDLAELREEVQGELVEESRAAKVELELGALFELRARRTARARIRLDREGLARLALATYRWARTRERERLALVESLEVTTSHDLLAFVRR